MLCKKILHTLKKIFFPHKPIYTKTLPSLSQYKIGEYTYGFPRVLSWGEGTRLEIGRFCSIAEGVVILLGGEHRVDWATTYPFPVIFPEARNISGHPRSKGDVIIGNDVWLGKDAMILSGVNIGNGAVIAARSVVTRNIPPYAIATGNPAKIIHYRFTHEQIQALEMIQWWNWPREKIVAFLPLMLSKDIDTFIQTAQQTENVH